MGSFFRVNWIYSLYINLKIIKGIKAFLFPIWIGYSTKVVVDRGAKIELYSHKPGCVQLGVSSGSLGRGRKMPTSIYVHKNATVIAKGVVVICKKSSVEIDAGATLILGNNFSANSGLCVKCSDEIVIGDGCIVGWDTTIMDKDGHSIFINGCEKNNKGKINIGSHVWIAADVTILKGCIVEDGVIIGTKSLLTAKRYDTRSIYAGNPARKISENIEWMF